MSDGQTNGVHVTEADDYDKVKASKISKKKVKPAKWEFGNYVIVAQFNIVNKELRLLKYAGVGWAMSLISLLTGVYYNVVVAVCLRYIFDVITLQSSKWTSCDNYWNSDSRFRLLKISASISEVGTFNWEIFIALVTGLGYNVPVVDQRSFCYRKDLISNCHFALCHNRGGFSVIMLIRGVTMDGAKTGIDYYLLKPDMNKVFRLKTWLEAAKQLCFSLGIGFGGLLALASFNKKDHNCFRDAIVVTICDCLMSIIGGVAVFSTLGALSKSSGKPIDVLFKYDGLTQNFITTLTDQFTGSTEMERTCVRLLLVSSLLQLDRWNCGAQPLLSWKFSSLYSSMAYESCDVTYERILESLMGTKVESLALQEYFISTCWTVFAPLILLTIVAFGIVADLRGLSDEDSNPLLIVFLHYF
ncbi:Sodium:neurotransmitter symporter family protein [Cooperia oncophora]